MSSSLQAYLQANYGAKSADQGDVEARKPKKKKKKKKNKHKSKSGNITIIDDDVPISNTRESVLLYNNEGGDVSLPSLKTLYKRHDDSTNNDNKKDEPMRMVNLNDGSGWVDVNTDRGKRVPVKRVRHDSDSDDSDLEPPRKRVKPNPKPRQRHDSDSDSDMDVNRRRRHDSDSDSDLDVRSRPTRNEPSKSPQHRRQRHDSDSDDSDLDVRQRKPKEKPKLEPGSDSDSDLDVRSKPIKREGQKKEKIEAGKTIFRDSKGAKIKDVKAVIKENKEGEVLEWSTGLAQKQAKLDEQIALHRSKYETIGRAEDDANLHLQKKLEFRVDDPILQMRGYEHVLEREQTKYLEAEGKDASMIRRKAERPMYQGTPWMNRYHILPGYRWDGVDRSNGFEMKKLQRMSEMKDWRNKKYRYENADM